MSDLAGGHAERYAQMLAAATGGAGGRLAVADPPRRLYTWIGRRGYLRQAHGAGWALVGDAGSFLDPLSTHGITDALRDAELLARAVARTGPGTDPMAGLAGFARERDRVLGRLFGPVDRAARYDWDVPQLRRHLLELSSAMTEEVELIAGGSGLRVPS